MWNAPSRSTACKKKLHQLNPDRQFKRTVTIQQTKRVKKQVRVTAQSNERLVRETLAHKLSGTHLGLWLLIPEYLRLGAWDLLKGIFQKAEEHSLSPHIGLQLVNEAALCEHRIRPRSALCNQGFALANGLSFLAADETVHELLDSHTVREYQTLQITLSQLRRLQGHYDPQNILVIDPHRICSSTQRIMPKKKKRPAEPAYKMLQTFFCNDALSGQPLAFTIGSSGKTCSKATMQLLELLQQSGIEKALLVADKEHFTAEILNHISNHTNLDILVAAPYTQKITACFDQLHYQPLWAGYAIGQTDFKWNASSYPYQLIVQREGEKPQAYTYKAFLSTRNKNAVELLTQNYPQRWSIEEFFNFEGDMGWNRASTFNLNIRYGKQSLALIAQAATHQLKNKLPKPYNQWTARHTAAQILTNMEGDLRVKDDTIIVTYYRDHCQLGIEPHYRNLPTILEREGINPKIPWLCDFKLDFRFK